VAPRWATANARAGRKKQDHAPGLSIKALMTVFAPATDAVNLTGHAFSQTLTGNAGANVVIGGGGADSFVCDTAPGAGNVDRILDFTPGSDRVHLDNTIVSRLADDALAAGSFAGNAAGLALSGADRIIHQASSGRLFYDAEGSGGGAAVLFATLTPV